MPLCAMLGGATACAPASPPPSVPPHSAPIAAPAPPSASGWWQYDFPNQECDAAEQSPAVLITAYRSLGIEPETHDVTIEGKVIVTFVSIPKSNGISLYNAFFRTEALCEAYARSRQTDVDKYR